MRKLAIIISAVSIVMLYAMPVLAHGVRISHTIDNVTGEITVTAEFDTGEALGDGQVIIFAPNDLINPWQVGVADENGSYTFMPDYEIEGFWDIQVRKAGHGGLVNVEITTDMMPDPSAIPADAEDATTITLSDGTQVTITGATNFTVEGDVVTFDTDSTAELQEPADTDENTESTEAPSTLMSSNSGGGITDGLTPLQQAVMIGSVIWGLIGTALFFSRGKSKA